MPRQHAALPNMYHATGNVNDAADEATREHQVQRSTPAT